MPNLIQILVGIITNITNLITSIQNGVTGLVTTIGTAVVNGLRRAYRIARIMLIVAVSGLALAAGLLLWGLVFESTIMVQLGGILAAAMCFLIWLMPMAFNWLIKSTLANLPEGYGEYFDKLAEGIKSLSSFLINVAFILSSVAVLAGFFIGLPATLLLGIIAFSMGLFFVSLIGSVKFPVWRTVLVMASIFCLFWQSYALIAPNKTKKLQGDFVEKTKKSEVVVVKDAPLYQIEQGTDKAFIVGKLENESKGWVIDNIPDKKTGQEMYVVTLESSPGNVVGGRTIIVSSGSTKEPEVPSNPDFKQVKSQQEIKTDVQPVSNQLNTNQPTNVSTQRIMVTRPAENLGNNTWRITFNPNETVITGLDVWTGDKIEYISMTAPIMIKNGNNYTPFFSKDQTTVGGLPGEKMAYWVNSGSQAGEIIIKITRKK